MRSTRGALLVIGALAVLAVTPASARPGGTTTTRAGTLGTIGVAATASDNSVCSQVTIAGIQNWQCTPVLVATGNAFHPVVNAGGTLSWTGTATCEYRKRADGFNNDWTAWTSCGPLTRTGTSSRSWPSGGSPGSGSIVLTWARILNSETAFTTDCVEIRTTITTAATATSPLEVVTTSARYPSVGTNLSGICEGGGAY